MNSTNVPVYTPLRSELSCKHIYSLSRSSRSLDNSSTAVDYFEYIHSDIVPLENLKLPELKEELDRLIVYSSTDINSINYMVVNDHLVPSSKSVILALLSNNNELYDVIYCKFRDNLYKNLNVYKNDGTEEFDSIESNSSLALCGTSPFGATCKNVFLEDNVIDLAKFIGYYGNINILKKFHNDFHNYLYSNITIEKSSIGNCMCYAACAGNLDIIKFVLDYINSSYLKAYTPIQETVATICNHLREVVSVAVYYSKKDIYELICDQYVGIQFYIMDVCVYNGNLDLLKEIYNKYGRKVSYLTILYCIEKDMVDFIIYFISDMKIECCEGVLYYCNKKGLNHLVKCNNDHSNSIQDIEMVEQTNISYKRKIEHIESERTLVKRKIVYN